MLVWMSEQPLVAGRQYWIKHTTRRTSGEIEAIRYAIDVNTFSRRHVPLRRTHCRRRGHFDR